MIKGNLGMKEALRILFALNGENFRGFSGMSKVIFLLVIFIICELITEKKEGIQLIRSKKAIVRWMLYLTLIFFIYFFQPITYSTNFIYQNF